MAINIVFVTWDMLWVNWSQCFSQLSLANVHCIFKELPPVIFWIVCRSGI